jgi:hypothetical protein
MHLILYSTRLSPYAGVMLTFLRPLRWQPGAETCRGLILVTNCILLSLFVCLCINYKNVQGMSNIKIANAQQKLSTITKDKGNSLYDQCSYFMHRLMCWA